MIESAVPLSTALREEAMNRRADLDAWDAGADDYVIRPRGWLLGSTFCRGFVSALIGDGAVGKTALRNVQLTSLAIGQPLTGEHVFQRCRVLILGLEDTKDEMRRRIAAIIKYHHIDPTDLSGQLYLSTPRDLHIAEMRNGAVATGDLDAALRRFIGEREIDVVALDPLVKAHQVEENDNGAMDKVSMALAAIASDLNCSIDFTHHARKGIAAAGDADRGRGASSTKDGARLVYTLTRMSMEEAQGFGLAEAERRGLIRLDSAKVNIAPPAADARWFKLVGVDLGNGTADYPAGDIVQTVELWESPDTWAGLSSVALNDALNEIDAGMENGQRFSGAAAADKRAAWPVLQRHCPEKTERQCREIINAWAKTGLLVKEDYEDPVERKQRSGLRVNATKRPT